MICTFYISGIPSSKCTRIKFYKFMFVKFKLIAMDLNAELNKEKPYTWKEISITEHATCILL